jgi:hypothetical protein
MSQMRITFLKVLLAAVRMVGQIAATQYEKREISNTLNTAAEKISQCEQCKFRENKND